MVHKGGREFNRPGAEEWEWVPLPDVGWEKVPAGGFDTSFNFGANITPEGDGLAGVAQAKRKAGETPPGDKPDKPDSPDGPWGEPLPLGVLAAPAPFPLDVLPAEMRRFALESVEALNAAPDYVAVPMLVLAGAAAGRTRWLAQTSV